MRSDEQGPIGLFCHMVDGKLGTRKKGLLYKRCIEFWFSGTGFLRVMNDRGHKRTVVIQNGFDTVRGLGHRRVIVGIKWCQHCFHFFHHGYVTKFVFGKLFLPCFDVRNVSQCMFVCDGFYITQGSYQDLVLFGMQLTSTTYHRDQPFESVFCCDADLIFLRMTRQIVDQWFGCMTSNQPFTMFIGYGVLCMELFVSF